MGHIPEGDGFYLSDLQDRCIRTEVGYFHVGWNESCWTDYPTLRIGEKTYSKGIGVHAPAEVMFDIDGQFKTFAAEVGMMGIPLERKADKTKVGSCTFVVEGDSRILLETPVLYEGELPLHIGVDISGVKILTLRITDGGDSNWDDLATWGNVRIERWVCE